MQERSTRLFVKGKRVSEPLSFFNTTGQKRIGREAWVRMEKIIATVLHETHERQVGEATDALEEGPESFYRSGLDRSG